MYKRHSALTITSHVDRNRQRGPHRPHDSPVWSVRARSAVGRVKKTSVGFNIGADITWALSSHFGVGTLTRYSRASVTLNPGSESGVHRAVEPHAGGLHLGGRAPLSF